MPKPQTDRPAVPARTDAKPLGANVRRHLGQNLRAHYADAITAPMPQRLEELLAQLDKPKP